MEFFSPVHLIAYMDGDVIKVDSSSFIMEDLSGYLDVTVISWKTFDKTPVNPQGMNVTIPADSSVHLWELPLTQLLDNKVNKVRICRETGFSKEPECLTRSLD